MFGRLLSHGPAMFIRLWIMKQHAGLSDLVKSMGDNAMQQIRTAVTQALRKDQQQDQEKTEKVEKKQQQEKKPQVKQQRHAGQSM